MKNSCCMNCENRIPPTKTSKGCRVTCEKWKAYEEKYQAEMRLRDSIDKDEYFGYIKQRTVENSKKYHKNEYGK